MKISTQGKVVSICLGGLCLISAFAADAAGLLFASPIVAIISWAIFSMVENKAEK